MLCQDKRLPNIEVSISITNQFLTLVHSGTEVCLCCTAKQCISQGGIDSPSKDLSTIFGGKFLPGLLSKLIGGIKKMPLPQLPLPNRVSLPSFSLPTLPRMPHVSLPELPIPQISSFQNPIHYIFKLGPMPRSQPRASFQDILGTVQIAIIMQKSIVSQSCK